MIKDILNDKKQYLIDYAKYIDIIKNRSLTAHTEKLQELSERRGIPVEILKEHGIFYIYTYDELMAPEYIPKLEDFGLINELNKQPIFHERWLIPIKDFDGHIINLVGYSPNAENRYLYGNSKYYDRKNDMYGLENFRTAVNQGWAVYVEGITDCLALRSLGFKNCFAACGTMSSEIKMRHLNQLKHGIIFITDRDKAGDTTLKHWRTNCCVYVSISIETQLKDIDDYINKVYDLATNEKLTLSPISDIRAERAENVINTLNMAVDWLKEQGEHNKILDKHIRYANITLT